MMKQTLSLLMLVSLGSGTAMAFESTEWLSQQEDNLKTDESVLCTSGLEAAVSGLSFIGYQENVLANLGKYEAATRDAINNLAKTGQSNAAIYNAFSHTMKKWDSKFYGRPIVSCVAPYLNFQDLYRQEVVAANRFKKSKDQKDFKAMMGARQAQLNLANRALIKIKSLQKAAQ